MVSHEDLRFNFPENLLITNAQCVSNISKSQFFFLLFGNGWISPGVTRELQPVNYSMLRGERRGINRSAPFHRKYRPRCELLGGGIRSGNMLQVVSVSTYPIDVRYSVPFAQSCHTNKSGGTFHAISPPLKVEMTFLDCSLTRRANDAHSPRFCAPCAFHLRTLTVL